MLRHAFRLMVCLLLLAAPASAQSRPATLSTLFEDIFGPNGLVVSSDDVQLDGTTHAAHFNSAFQSEFRLMNIALTSQLAAIPLPSPASGFTYKFDPSTGTFVRSTSSFGPILAERGETIGKGRLAFGVNYQFLSFDRLDGVSLAAVPAVFTHDNYQSGGGRADIVSTQNTIESTVSQFSSALTYGITDRLDVSLAVPMVRTRLSLISNATLHRIGTGSNVTIHYFHDDTAVGGFGSTKQFFAEGSAGGVGDIVLRAKGNIFREGRRALAAGVDVRLPTGDEYNLLGAGAAGVRPFTAFSMAIGPLAPHVNLAYQWNGNSVLAGDVRTNTKGDLPDQFGYALGSDAAVNSRLTMVFELLGQRVLDSPRLFTHVATFTGQAGSATVSDLSFTTGAYWLTSGAVGFKANVARRLLINCNLRFQPGQAGLTDRITPLIGIEWGF